MRHAERKANKEKQFLKELIDKMFELAGHDLKFEDVEGRKDNWFQQWEMTVEQADEWKKWGVEYLRKNLKINKASAEKEMLWVNLMWGLKYSNPEMFDKKI